MMKHILTAMLLLAGMAAFAEDNMLTPREKADGWLLLFDGKTLDGWKTSDMQPSKTPVEDGCINPHGCGGYMMINEKEWTDFVLSLDFKISPGCNSGIFLRTFPLTPPPGKDVGWNGIEVQVIDTKTNGMTDTGAIYDLSAPTKNAMKPAGEWNHIEVTVKGNVIDVVLNGEKVNHADLDKFDKTGKRPDGSDHKFSDLAFKDHPKHGYIGLQDHGSPCWYKNIKIKPPGSSGGSGPRG
jgi:hypothetical protein